MVQKTLIQKSDSSKKKKIQLTKWNLWKNGLDFLGPEVNLRVCVFQLNLPIMNRMPASLDLAASVPAQPPLMGNVDPSKIDEIRRTVYVGNLNSQVGGDLASAQPLRQLGPDGCSAPPLPPAASPQTTTAEQLLEFFKQVGDVKFVRMAGDETQPTRFAFVEFMEQDSVARALTFNGVMFGDRPLKYVLKFTVSLHHHPTA